jgi:hypothetical protein
MTTQTALPRILVALHRPRAVPAFISLGRAIVRSMTDNPAFPSPTPPLADVTSAIADLDTAQAATLARTRGTVEVRNDKLAALVDLLQELRGYVQKVANANRESATAIIESAGMFAGKTAARAARALVASSGPFSGTVKVELPTVAHRAAYEWQHSTDGGATWVIGVITLQAKTVVSGLQPGAMVLFRVRPVTKAGQGDWSQPVSIIVR